MSWFLPYTPPTCHPSKPCQSRKNSFHNIPQLAQDFVLKWQSELLGVNYAAAQELSVKKFVFARTQDKQFALEEHSFFLTIMMMRQAITLTEGTKNGNIGDVLEGGVNWLIVCFHFAFPLGTKKIFPRLMCWNASVFINWLLLGRSLTRVDGFDLKKKCFRKLHLNQNKTYLSTLSFSITECSSRVKG